MKKTPIQLPRQTHSRLKKRGLVMVPRVSAPALADAILTEKLNSLDARETAKKSEGGK